MRVGGGASHRGVLLAPLLGGLLVLSACGATEGRLAEPPDSTRIPSDDRGCPTDEAIAAAVGEGRLEMIAPLDAWANYGAVRRMFGDQHSIDIDVTSDDDVIDVVTTTGDDATRPDVVDVTPEIAAELDALGLWETYKPCSWDEIPDDLKDANGKWVAAYFGLMTIGVNTTIVEQPPSSFAELEDERYRGLIALNGDPRESEAALHVVLAAALANGGSYDDILPGIEYFARLKESGNLLTVGGMEAGSISGVTAIWLDWSYNQPIITPALEAGGIEWVLRIPIDGVHGNRFVQGVVRGARNPAAARLWIDHVVSDESAQALLRGGVVPARLAALTDSGLAPQQDPAFLVEPSIIERVRFASPAQISAAREVLLAQWGPLVANR